MNANLRIIVLFLSIGLITSCDHYSTQMDNQAAVNFSQISPASGYFMTFKDYLEVEYSNLANYEQTTTYDYKAAKHYMGKVKKLQAGYLVSPDSLKNSNLKPEYKADLKLARKQLLTAIQKYARPENRAALALAQTRYDCWLDQAKSWPEDQERLTCKAQFEENMALIYLPEVENLENNYIFDRI